MNPRSWLNLLMLLAIGGLIALVVYQPGIAPPPAAQPLTRIDPTDVQRLELQRPGQPGVILTRSGPRQWQMEQPFQSPASPFIDANLGLLLSAHSSVRYPLAELDPANIGLQPPVATLQVDDTRIEFGDIDPIHGNRYVQVGKFIHLVPEHLTYYPKASAAELVSPALLPEAAVIERLQLPALPADTPDFGAAPARTLSRVDGSWRLEPALPLSGDALPGLINEWRHAQALSLSPLAADAADDASLGTITLSLSQGDPIALDIVSLTPDLVLLRRDTGLRYHFSAAQRNRLLRPSSHNPVPTKPVKPVKPVAAPTSP